MGFLGVSRFDLSGGYLLGEIPYPIAFNPIGNETPIYASFAYNRMNFFEFSNDRFISLLLVPESRGSADTVASARRTAALDRRRSASTPGRWRPCF